MGQSFEHRRGWMEDRLLALPSIFTIDIAAYAIMSNHYHVVLHVNQALAESWSDFIVVTRWHGLFKGRLLTQKFARHIVVKKSVPIVGSSQGDEFGSVSGIIGFLNNQGRSFVRESNN